MGHGRGQKDKAALERDAGKPPAGAAGLSPSAFPRLTAWEIELVPGGLGAILPP